MWVEHGAEVGLGGEVELVVDAAGAVGAQPHLGGGLLAGDVEGAVLRSGRSGRRPRAAAWSCRRRARRRAGSRRRAPARRRAPGRARARRWCGTASPRPSTCADRHGRARSPAPAVRPLRRGARPRRPSPRPGTRRSGRPTWRSPSRTRCSGRRPWGLACGLASWACRTLGERHRHSRGTTCSPRVRVRRIGTIQGIGTIERPEAMSRSQRVAGRARGRRRSPADAGRRRRARPASPARPSPTRVNNPDLLRPDTLERVQRGDRRARLLAQPRRPQPAHPHLPPDRPALRARPGGHRQRADGPLRALPGRDRRARPATTCCCSPATPTTRSAGYDDLLRSTAVDAFVVTDTYLGNPQAAWLQRAAGAVRGLRPAVGRARRRATRGSTSTAPPAPSWPPSTCSSRATSGSPGSAGARTRRIGEDRRAAGRARCTTRGLSTTGLASRVEDTVASGARGRRRAARRVRAHRASSAPPTPWHGRAAHALPSAASRPAATSRSSASTTPRSPRSARRG